MTKTRVQLKEGGEVEALEFIAWKDDRREFYARPRNGKPRVFTLAPSLPRGATWGREPFPECAPVEIVPCRLMPPPCRESAAAWRATLEVGAWAEPWEAVYMAAHRQGLHLTKADDKELRKRLAAFIDAGHDDPLPEITPEMVRRDFGGIRNAYLVETWARDSGRDLGAMAEERGRFRRWLEDHAGERALIRDKKTRTRREGLIPLKFHDDAPRLLALAAAVRFRVEFEDGSSAWLTDCPPPRVELRPEERKEMRELGFETGRERKIKAGRVKGGKATTKAKDALTMKAIGDEVRKHVAAHLSRNSAGELAVKKALTRYGLKITARTALNYEKSTRDP